MLEFSLVAVLGRRSALIWNLHVQHLWQLYNHSRPEYLFVGCIMLFSAWRLASLTLLVHVFTRFIQT
jgi:hypothetical protein